jgi:hypothetical protein
VRYEQVRCAAHASEYTRRVQSMEHAYLITRKHRSCDEKAAAREALEVAKASGLAGGFAALSGVAL